MELARVPVSMKVLVSTEVLNPLKVKKRLISKRAAEDFSLYLALVLLGEALQWASEKRAYRHSWLMGTPCSNCFPE